MKYINIFISYLFLLAITVFAYLLLTMLLYLIIHFQYFLESNFSFITDALKLMVGSVAYTSPSFFVVEIVSIMGSGYIMDKAVDKLSDKSNYNNVASLLVLVTISLFFLVTFFIMLFNQSSYWFFDYLITFISPILFILGMVASDKF